MIRYRSRRAYVVAFGIVIVASSAHAQLSAQEKAVADAFFNDGLKLLRAGKFADACPKLAESERIDPAVGTALYLGECYERIGKIASARAMFQEGYDYAKRRGDGRAAVAKDHHDKLNPSTLTISLAPNTRQDGLQITRDGEVISTVELGVALPTDGGAHAISVTAPGKKTFTVTVDVAVKEGTSAVTIPQLEDEEKKIDARVVVAPVDTGGARRVAGLVVAGVGVAGLVVGSLAGIIATLDWNASNSSDNGCNSGTTLCLTQHGIDLRSSAETWATVSTISLVAGGVCAVAGALIYFTAPKAKITKGWTITPTPLVAGAGVVAAGRF